MIKILAAIGLGSALMLAPALALADDAANPPAASSDKTMSKSTTKKTTHHTTKKKTHHTMKKSTKKTTTKPAPDNSAPAGGDQPKS